MLGVQITLPQSMTNGTFTVRMVFASLLRALRAGAMRGVFAFTGATNRTSAQMGVLAVQASANGADATFKVLAAHLDEYFAPMMIAEARHGAGTSAPYRMAKRGAMVISIILQGIEFRRALLTEIVLGIVRVAAAGGRGNPFAGHQT
jgi:hypothetical protein